MALRVKPFENIVEEGENAGNQHFLLLPQCFLPCQGEISDKFRSLVQIVLCFMLYNVIPS